MSVHVMSWVLRHSEATLGDRLVLLVLADHAKADGSAAWPAVATIAHEARLSERQAIRCLGALREAGAIVQTGTTKQGCRVYQVVMSGGDILSGEGVTFTARGGADLSPEPSLQATVLEPSPLAADAAGEEIDKTDHCWEAFAEVFGEVTNEGSRARRNKAVKLVKQSLASAGVVEPAAIREEVRRRARTWQATFERAKMTDTALANGWDLAAHRTPAPPSPSTTRHEEPADVLPAEENARRARELHAHMQTIGKEIP